MQHNVCMIRSASPLPANLTAGALPRVLITGFDAFGGASINPSWLAVKALDAEILAGHQLVAAQLPTAFDASPKALSQLLTRHKPRLVICVGQAGGRSALSIERIAINMIDASMADNAGQQPVDAPVVASGPAAYFSTLPIKAMLQALQRAGLAAEVSQTAGTFVCNHVFYALMHALATKRGFKRARGGFIHVPWLAEQGTPSMPLTDMVRGLRLAIECALMARHAPAVTNLSAGKIS